MLYFRYRGSIVLVPGLFLTAAWVAQSDICVGATSDETCSGRKEDDGDLLGPTPSMVQRDVLESELSVDEERQEAPEIAAPTMRLSKAEAPEIEAPTTRLSKAEATLAPRMAQFRQLPPSNPSVASDPKVADSKDAGSFMEALDSRYTAGAAAGAQLLRSMKLRVAAEFREFLRRLGVAELELVATRASWTLVFFVPLAIVGVIVLVIAMRAWWTDMVVNKERDGWWEQKPRPTRGGGFRDASSVPQPQQASHASQPPSVMGLLASPGKPRDLTPGKTPGKTPQKPATPLLQQTDWPAERRSTTPAGLQPDSPKHSLDQLARGAHLCSELVVPENNECSLLLPEIMESRFNASGVLSIDDVNGMAVLYAAYSLAARPPPGPHDLPGNGKRLILRSALEDIILASCKDAEPVTVGGPPELTIFNKTEEPFGVLRPTSQGPRSSYLVSLSTGKKMSIRRDIQALSSCITDEDGWLLACSEDAGERGRTIRISPQVDAGLMTLIMLGIDILDITMAARGDSDHALPPGNPSHSHTPHQHQSRTASR